MSSGSIAAHDHGHDHAHHGPTGLARWLFTTNHKDIGTMYLMFSMIMFLIGGSLILSVRAELFQPGIQIVQPELFNQLIGLHALVMIFAALIDRKSVV